MGKAIICDYCKKITPDYVKETESHPSGSGKDLRVCQECYDEYFKQNIES